MRCPACHHQNTRVLDSRGLEHDNAVRRRRQCSRCSFRFSTREEMEILDLSVIKRDGRREAYSREKLSLGLARALEKRPITKQEFSSLVAAVERDINLAGKEEIKTSEIGEIAMRHLAGLDKVAYIRFASVYRAFTDVASFHDEIKKLSAGGARKKTIRRPIKKKKYAKSVRAGKRNNRKRK